MILNYLGNTTEPSSIAYSFTSLAVNSFKYAKNDCSIVGGNVVFKYSISIKKKFSFS